MIRPYLGRGYGLRYPQSQLRFFTLCNLPIYLESLVELQIDVEHLATAVAEAPAFIHWVAEVDANDVEFVLAGRNTHHTRLANTSIPTSPLDKLELWLLDFDCCRKMSMTEEGVEKAATAFMRNDPYFPKPPTVYNGSTKSLWLHFCAEYLEKSRVIVMDDYRAELPALFMEKVKCAHAAHEAWKASKIRIGGVSMYTYPLSARSSGPDSSE